MDGHEMSYKLPRSHGEESDVEIGITLPVQTDSVFLTWRRYKTDDSWHHQRMTKSDSLYTACLPQQPPAGKLEYVIVVHSGEKKQTIPAEETVVVRFRGPVPAGFLVPHVLFMFLAMFLSNLTAIEALTGAKRLVLLSSLTCISLFLGGMILGPVVQKYAFGAFWTGIPFGWDLTDNKTFFGMVGWLIALVQVWRKPTANRWWALTAALLMLVIFSIPHSMMGSELDYETMNVVTGD